MAAAGGVTTIMPYSDGLDSRAVHALVAERHPAVGRFMLRTSLLREDPALARRLVQEGAWDIPADLAAEIDHFTIAALLGLVVEACCLTQQRCAEQRDRRQMTHHVLPERPKRFGRR